ncbi:MAG: ABC transporter substrate-binding protein [Alphaproteobacteria bacterium]|nr:ABC transporter substrate-binding protein [Alphaproteobacteria bacterium]
MKTLSFLLAASVVAAMAQPARAEADIPLGIAVASTGRLAAIGTQAMRGAEVAVAAINAEGGVLGRKLRLVPADDACDPRQAVSVADRLVSEKVGLVVGHLCSAAAIAAAPIYAAAGTIMITASATNPALTERGLANVFRACGRDDRQGAVAGVLPTRPWRGRRIAVIHDRSAYGQGLARQAVATMREHGIATSMAAAVNAGERDFTAIATRLRKQRIDVVYFGGDHTELGPMVRQARRQGVEATFVSGEALATAEFWAIAGSAGEGTLITDAPEVKGRPAAAAALAQLRAAGTEPDNFSFYHYAAIQLVARAIAAAGSERPAAVAAALRAGSFDTVVGTMAFDAKGDLKAPFHVVYEWRRGAFEAARL